MTGYVKKYVINIPGRDDWKIKRMEKSMKDNNIKFDYTIWQGVVVKKQPKIYKWAINNKLISHQKNIKYGNMGAALAHLSLWDKISKFKNDNEKVLIMEDNVLMTSETMQGIEFLSSLDFDFLNACVLRPRGNPTNIPNLLQIQQTKVKELLPNVWLSSYFITPLGCRKILTAFKKHNFNVSNTIIDRCLVYILHSNSNIKAYVVDNKRYFGHIETKDDTRRKENYLR